MTFVCTYEELPSLVGRELPPSPWRPIDQRLIDLFAEATGDHQWIHVDVERAEREIGGTIAHGFLTMSLMSAMSPECMRINGVGRALNYGFDKLRFTGTVPAGSKVRLRTQITKVEDRLGGRLMTRHCAVDVQNKDGTVGDKPVIVADWLGLVFPA